MSDLAKGPLHERMREGALGGAVGSLTIREWAAEVEALEVHECVEAERVNAELRARIAELESLLDNLDKSNE